MKSISFFTKYIIAFSTISIGIVFTGSFTMIWIRQQITRVATNCKILENELKVHERKNMSLVAHVSSMQAPEALKGMINNQMQTPKSNQIIWIQDTQLKQDYFNINLPAYIVSFNSTASLKQPVTSNYIQPIH